MAGSAALKPRHRRVLEDPHALAQARRGAIRGRAFPDAEWPRSDRKCRQGRTSCRRSSAISFLLISRNGWTPLFASVSMMPFHEPTCFAQVAPQIQPSRRNSASMPFSLQNFSMLSADFPNASPNRKRALFAAEGLQGRKFRPLRQHHAGIAPRGAAAANIGFDDRHIECGIARLDFERRPHAGIAAADDADIGALGAFEPRRIGFARRDRFAQPDAAAFSSCRARSSSQKATRSPPLSFSMARASAGVAISSDSSERMRLILVTCSALLLASVPGPR